jgi:hypothetical protein
MRQAARALAELNIICANSSQAKGRVERINRTPPGPSGHGLDLPGVCDMESSNEFLAGFP